MRCWWRVEDGAVKQRRLSDSSAIQFKPETAEASSKCRQGNTKADPADGWGSTVGLFVPTARHERCCEPKVEPAKMVLQNLLVAAMK